MLKNVEYATCIVEKLAKSYLPVNMRIGCQILCRGLIKLDRTFGILRGLLQSIETADR